MFLEFSFESFILQRSPDAAQMDAHHLPELATLFPTDYKYHFTQHSLPRADYFYSDKLYNLFSLHPDSPSEKQQKHKDKKMRGGGKKKQEEEELHFFRISSQPEFSFHETGVQILKGLPPA